jgi:3-dehydroquinate dehydratase-2
MSNTEARGIEPVTSGEAVGVVAGLGANSYLVGLDALLGVIAERRESA